MCDVIPTTRPQWQKAMSELPNHPSTLPAFFFAHGQPMLIFPKGSSFGPGPFGALAPAMGPEGTLAQFLEDFGKTLLEKYSPRAIVVFSAHWESQGDEILVSDYEGENPLLMDFYGFPKELYDFKFKSKGDHNVSVEVVEALRKAGLLARTSPKTEPRGYDARGFKGPGFDHGVSVPFKLMFGEEMEIPVIQVTIDGSLDPSKEWALGKAVASLRSQGILILSGGLTYHNLRDFDGFAENTAKPVHKEFHNSVLAALQQETLDQRQRAMYDLSVKPGFRESHPRADHFVPIYIAGGAAEEGNVKVLGGMYGMISAAFGV